jgi:hypothetical protein
VRSPLHNPPLIQHHNLIDMGNGGQPVSNDQDLPINKIVRSVPVKRNLKNALGTQRRRPDRQVKLTDLFCRVVHLNQRSRIGHLETFEKDWQLLCDQVPTLGPVPHKNKGSHGADYMEFYTPEAEQMARKRYARDFELVSSYKRDAR